MGRIIRTLTLYQIADHLIDYRFHYPETAQYFSRFAVDKDPALAGEIIPTSTTLQYMENLAERNGWPQASHSPWNEYQALASATSAALLPHGAFLFHSSGFVYQGKAIVCTGPSGIGKTTQYAQWRRNYGDAVKIISGDMTAFVLRENEIIVMPTAWNGKENLHSDAFAPLGGIILLKQAEGNTIKRLQPADSILPIYAQMCLSRTEPEQITSALDALDRLLRRTPIWQMSSRGDLASARLCHDSIAGEIYGE